jgi:hypothetical protein
MTSSTVERQATGVSDCPSTPSAIANCAERWWKIGDECLSWLSGLHFYSKSFKPNGNLPQVRPSSLNVNCLLAEWLSPNAVFFRKENDNVKRCNMVLRHSIHSFPRKRPKVIVDTFFHIFPKVYCKRLRHIKRCWKWLKGIELSRQSQSNTLDVTGGSRWQMVGGARPRPKFKRGPVWHCVVFFARPPSLAEKDRKSLHGAGDPSMSTMNSSPFSKILRVWEPPNRLAVIRNSGKKIWWYATCCGSNSGDTR